MKKYLLTTCLGVLAAQGVTLAPAPVLAQNPQQVQVNPQAQSQLDENGQKLKTMLNEYIESYKNLYSGAEGLGLRFEGDVNVEKVDNYYAVTLPFISVDMEDGSSFELGLIGINAAPHDTPGQWKMTFALPAKMRMLDTDQQEVGTIVIGGQRSSGIFNETLQYFTKLDSNFQNIVTTNKVDGVTFSLPETRVVYDLESNEQGLWSGPTFMTVSNLSAKKTGSDENILTIGSLGMNSEMFGYDPAIMNQYREKLESFLNVNRASETIGFTAPQGQELALLLLQMIGDGLIYDVYIEDFNLDAKVTAPQGLSTEEPIIRLGKAHMGVDLTGLKETGATLNLRLGYDNLSISPMMENAQELMPTNLNLDFALTQIPVQELVELTSNTFAGKNEDEQVSGIAAMSLAFKLPALLSKAGTSLQIKDNFYGNDMYHVDMNGAILSNLTAANGITADIDTNIKGLDQVIESVSNQAVYPEATNAAALQQTLATLNLLRGFGKPGTSADGAPVHSYDIILNEKGQFLVNGQDMTMLMMMMNGMGASAAPSSQDQNSAMPSVPAVPPARVE